MNLEKHPLSHKGQGCPEMTNDSELTLFRIYNFRRSELTDVTGKVLPVFGVFLEPIVRLTELLIASPFSRAV